MYPLIVVFAVAAYENRLTVWRTALPLSGGGGVVAVYHSYIQSTESSTCSVGSGCETVQFELFGTLSIPNLSLLAFTIITVVLALAVVRERRR
jgi:disulfide bond formation protein DsbB